LSRVPVDEGLVAAAVVVVVVVVELAFLKCGGTYDIVLLCIALFVRIVVTENE
jgi:hypothetical protein